MVATLVRNEQREANVKEEQSSLMDVLNGFVKDTREEELLKLNSLHFLG